MNCWKCDYELPDSTDVCPVCGSPTRSHVRKVTKTVKRLVFSMDVLTMLCGVIHIFIWATASHYIRGTVHGLLWDRQLQYEMNPKLLAVDVIFAILFLAIPALSAIMRYQLFRFRKSGKIFLAISFSLTLLWGILYPLSVQAVNGVSSPLWTVVIIQSVAYAALGIMPAVLLLRSDEFIY